MKLFCPFCMKEIMPDEIQCPSCGTTFGLGTLLLLRRLSKEAPPGYSNEQRKRARVPKSGTWDAL